MPNLKQFDYIKALIKLEFIFEGATVPFIMLGETARRMRNAENLEGLEELEVGVTEKRMSDYSRRTLRDLLGADWENNVHIIEGVPVRIKLIKRNYKFFKNLDTVFYQGSSVRTANPFDNYWTARFIVT